MDNRPWSDRYREAAEDWVSKDSAATLLEECKSAVLSQRMAALGNKPVTHAERIVKSSEEWQDYITKMVEARRAANLARVKKEYIHMKAMEEASENATKRVEMRL